MPDELQCHLFQFTLTPLAKLQTELLLTTRHCSLDGPLERKSVVPPLDTPVTDTARFEQDAIS